MEKRYISKAIPTFPPGNPKHGCQPYPATVQAIESTPGRFVCPARGPGEWSLQELTFWAREKASSLAIYALHPRGDISEQVAYAAIVGH
jgi:hypothetical protein